MRRNATFRMLQLLASSRSAVWVAMWGVHTWIVIDITWTNRYYSKYIVDYFFHIFCFNRNNSWLPIKKQFCIIMSGELLALYVALVSQFLHYSMKSDRLQYTDSLSGEADADSCAFCLDNDMSLYTQDKLSRAACHSFIWKLTIDNFWCLRLF